MRRTLHPAVGTPLRRRDDVDDVLRAQCAAHETLAQDAALTAGLTNVRPRHLHLVHTPAPFDWSHEDEADG